MVMDKLTELIRNDMKPALGVTEPGAIAFAVSKARSYLTGETEKVNIRLNSGIYKNAFTCGIPNSLHFGNVYSAALGVVAGDPDLGLESLANVTPDDNAAAEKLVAEGRVAAELSEISSRIYIVAEVVTTDGRAVVTIRDSHTNITCIEVNGEIIFGEKESESCDGCCSSRCETDANESAGSNDNEPVEIHRYTLSDIFEYAKNVDADDIAFIMKAYMVNLELFEEGMRSERTTFLQYLLDQNEGKVFSKDEQKTASLLCNGAIEARVLGLDKPAMSITGSGAHGIIATMPLLAVASVRGISDEILTRATAISYLVCMYIKEYSGKLSAFCGCAIAAGTGMACGLIYLYGGGVEEMTKCIFNMASSITGMICDGGNHGCTMKGVVATDAAFRSAGLAMKGVYIESEHGINGMTPEDTMRNMGLIASPGMVATEAVIVDIMQTK